MVRRSLLAVAVAVVLASCGGSGGSSSTTTAAPTTVAVATTSAPPSTVPPSTDPPGVPRTATTQVTDMGPGEASISGTVVGPDGPVSGAIVRIERFSGDEVATATVQTAGGSWSLPSILGGSYRVLAYRPPDLGQATPDAFFLGSTEAKQLTTTLTRYSSNTILATVDPNPPLVGLPALLTVHFGGGSVDASGEIVTTGRPGVKVQLNVGAGLLIESAPVTVSDGTGAATWQVRCTQPGVVAVSLVMGNMASAVAFPPCTAPPAGAP